MIRFLAKVIYLIVGFGIVAALLHIAWLRESIEFMLTPAMLFTALIVFLAYYIIGCNLWEEKDERAYLYPECSSWLAMERKAQEDIDSGRVFHYPNMDEAIKSLKDNDDVRD